MSPAHQQAPFQQYHAHPAHASPLPQAATRTSTSQPPPRTHQFYHFSPLIHNAHQRIPFLCSARAHHKHRCFNYTPFAMTHALY